MRDKTLAPLTTRMQEMDRNFNATFQLIFG